MLSIIEQNRREAVKEYRESMAMPLADELELEYNRGWNDAKDMLPRKTYGLVCFFAGSFVGALTYRLFVWLLS